MTSLHVVDGTYELFRSYFAVPARTAPDGTEVGATYGLLQSMLALLARDDVTHVGIATDHVIESFRNRLFAGYKTGEGVDPGLLGQFEIAEAGLRALGLVVWPMVEHEADDALATAARLGAAVFDRVVIASPDKDLAQCVRDGLVVQWDRRLDVVRDEAAVVEKLGVPPRRVPDFLALVGDAADGIPGVPGFGAKTAAAVLAAHGSLEAVPDDPARWTAHVRGTPRLAATLAARRADAALYKRLATLVTDVPIAFDVDALRWKGAPRGPWTSFLARWGMDGLARRSRLAD